MTVVRLDVAAPDALEHLARPHTTHLLLGGWQHRGPRAFQRRDPVEQRSRQLAFVEQHARAAQLQQLVEVHAGLAVP
jgi:hypothetical protein